MERFCVLRNLLFSALIAMAIGLTGCGDDGDTGAAGTSQGTLAGTVTNSATGSGLADVSITLAPAVEGVTITTDADGEYSVALPIGVYDLTYSKTNFTTATDSVSITAGQTATEDKTLTPVSAVVVDAGANVTGAAPEDTVTLTANIEALDGSEVQSVLWEQTNSVTVIIAEPTANMTEVTLPAMAAYKAELFNVIAEPPISEADLPATIELPEGEFPGGLQDRFQVQALNHFQLEEAGLVTMKVTVTTTSGTYEDEVEIHADLPWKANPGVRTVPIQQPVLVHGGTQDGTQAAWDWSLIGPGSSTATLDNGTAQNPSFTPDVSGTYTLTEANSGTSITLIGGTWAGAITGQDAEGLPLAVNCTVCHNDTIAPDNFTPWRQSGHAEIFTNNLNTSTHYGESCFDCHTVGFNPDAVNSGMDDQADYNAFLAGDLLNNPGDNLAAMLAQFPNSARMGNIQCENCHGPQNGGAHMQGAPRYSLSSEVCGSCHGEPLRHARFQQWQLSSHANYDLAISRGTNANCSRCHSANGFIAWADLGFDAGSNVTVTWDATTVHPQTCPACHDPHNPGNISGDANNATVRVQDNTPPLTAGFTVINAGRGAICMVCHNTRRGLVNDDSPGTITTTGNAPHAGAQADVLMGQNAFFVETGVRGKHSLLTDTCARCHMEATAPPALLSYNLGGTNHTFFADPDICSECHTSITAAEVQAAAENQLNFLRTSLEETVTGYIEALLAGNETVTLTDVTDADGNDLPDVTIVAGDTVEVHDYADSHGNQAMTVSVNDTDGHVQLGKIIINQGLGDEANIIQFDPGVGAGEDTPGAVIAKAGWNFLMATNERSHGIHNPTFTLQIMAGAQQALDALQD